MYETKTLIQTTGMTEGEREAFLGEFKPNQSETLLGFASLVESFLKVSI